MVQSGSDSKLNHTKAIALEDIRVVQDYPDVFSEELPGMPLFVLHSCSWMS
jgi:hypothetical protein